MGLEHLPGGDVGGLAGGRVEEPGLAAVPHGDAAQTLVEPAVHHQLLVLASLPAQQEHHGLLHLLLLLHQAAGQAGGGETYGELQVIFLLWKVSWSYRGRRDRGSYRAIFPDFPSSPTSWSNLCRSELKFVDFLHLTQIADWPCQVCQTFYQPFLPPLSAGEIARREEHF